MGIGGPRTIIEITPKGEDAVRDHLRMMQELAKKLLPPDSPSS